MDDVGQPKAAVAARRARELQPERHIEAKVARFSADNALAETVNGLYKAELIHTQGPWTSVVPCKK